MKKVILSVVCLLLGACCWRSPDSHFYVMNSEGLSAMSERNLNIYVAEVKVPDLLDRQQMIIYHADNQQVNIMEFERWAEALPDILQNTVTNDLMEYLPNSYVKSIAYSSGNSGYTVNIEINKIEAYPDDKAKIYAWWNVQNSAGAVLKRRQKVYETAVAEKSVLGLVNAQNRAIHQLSADVAEQLLKL